MRFGRRGLRLARVPTGKKLSAVGAQLASDQMLAQRMLATQLYAMRLAACWPEFLSNHVAFRPRKLEIDAACPEFRIGVEVQGGIWRKGGGAHSRPRKIELDIEKQQIALTAGWLLLPVTPRDVLRARAVPLIEKLLQLRGWEP